MQSADPKQVVAYVGSKLGPQIANQIPDAAVDPEGRDAAMNALLTNPQFSKVLLA